jgi:hypothetical protein
VTRHLGRIAGILFLTSVVASDASAQDGRDPLMRLERTVRYSVEVLMDSARLMGLPTRPIESKALEGLAKNKPGRVILNAARNVFRSLRDARAVLGPKATEDELTAAASALNIGITQAELAGLSRAQQNKHLTVPLVVLVDLISRGVPRDTASLTISQLWQRGAADEDFLGLWRGVERDIVSGADPGAALLNRAREIPSRGPPPVSPPRPE